MKPFLLVLLVVAFATPSWAEPLRLNLSRSQTLNLPQPPAQRDSLVNGIVIGAIVGAGSCARRSRSNAFHNSRGCGDGGPPRRSHRRVLRAPAGRHCPCEVLRLPLLVTVVCTDDPTGRHGYAD